MKFFLRLLFIVASIILSVCYFLWVYSEAGGFAFKIKCLFVWGFCVACYTVVAAIMHFIYEQEFE